MMKRRGRGRPSVIEALASRTADQFEPIDVPGPLAHDATRGAQSSLEAAVITVNNVLA
jgi:hypothetical protein